METTDEKTPLKIALYGGKFDPPHLGHLMVANEALKSGIVDQVWFVPAKTHPWKKIQASGQDRLNMLKTYESEKIKVLDLDLIRDRPTITIDTITELGKRFPEYRFYWLCGADTVERFDTWEEHENLLKLMRFLVVSRPRFESEKLPKGFFKLSVDQDLLLDLSSTEIRSNRKLGLPISSFVIPQVEKYILDNNLYLGS